MIRPVFKTTFLTLSVCVLLLHAPVIIAEDTLSPVQKLTGPNERRWTFMRFEMFMGNEDKCLEGEDYTFYRNNTVLVRRCIKGSITEVKQNWRISAADDLDVMLNIGTDVYVLLFYQDPGKEDTECMILRKRATSKAVATKDKILCRKPNSH